MPQASPVVLLVVVAPVVQGEESSVPLESVRAEEPVEWQDRYSAMNCWTTPRHCCGFLQSIDRKSLALPSLVPWLLIRLSSWAASSNRLQWQAAPPVQEVQPVQVVLPA